MCPSESRWVCCRCEPSEAVTAATWQQYTMVLLRRAAVATWVVVVVALRLLLWVPGWRLPVWDAVDHDGLPALFGRHIVVVAAGDDQVVQVGSATGCPVGGVVDFGSDGRAGAAGEGAAVRRARSGRQRESPRPHRRSPRHARHSPHRPTAPWRWPGTVAATARRSGCAGRRTAPLPAPGAAPRPGCTANCASISCGSPRKPSPVGTARALSSASTSSCRYCNRATSASNSTISASSSASEAAASCSIMCSILLHRTMPGKHYQR
jgi:hypothetical protein